MKRIFEKLNAPIKDTPKRLRTIPPIINRLFAWLVLIGIIARLVAWLFSFS